MIPDLAGETFKPVPDVYCVLVTPALARLWMSRPSAKVRKTSTAVVSKYANQINRGTFAVTHQSIAIATDGSVLDGWHRLSAVIQADKACWMTVSFNADASTFSDIDRGSNRQAHQFINERYATEIQAASRIIGVVTGVTDATTVQYDLLAGNQSARCTLEIVEAWPELVELAKLAKRLNSFTKITPSSHLAILAMASRTVYADCIDEWAKGLESGVDLGDADPRLHLRNRFLKEYRILGAGMKKEGMILITKAWNAYVMRRPLKVLKYSLSEPWPGVVGFDPGAQD